ncbi:D-alanyl-D-alanine dipeptidase [Spirosomataceae bacterium TFI 002]|nr:D-alanyl-D-alanine dipeptidase [Spirosomataceae bacterium TFI 002]
MRIFGVIILFACTFWACSSTSEPEESAELIIEESEPLIELKPLKRKVSELEEKLLSEGLVNVKDQIPSIYVDLKYSTSNNFFGSDVYGDFDKAFLQNEVVESLAISQETLKGINKNLSLYIFDAVRPLSIQQILWDALDSIPPSVRKAYVADPEEGSIHNFGCAVDISIFDIANDTLLDMGTDYDFFGYLAYPRKEAEMLQNGSLNELQIKNRELLREVMGKGKFMPITSEWWHFNRYSRNTAKEKYGIVK